MTRDDDFIGQLEGYLYEFEGLTPLPDPIRDAVRAEIPRTRQIGPPWGPMRYLRMSNNVKLALAAAVVVVLAIIGVGVLLPRLDIGGPTPTESPSAAPLPSAGQLDAGRYLMTANAPVPLTFSVPAGWSFNSAGFIIKHEKEAGEIGFTSWEVTHIFGNACHWNGTLVAVAGTSVESMANALAAQKEQGTSAPVDVTVGGYPGKRVDLSEPAGFDFTACDSGTARLWPDVGGDLNGGWRIHQPDQQDGVFILDVNGKRIVLDMWQHPGTSPADITEMEGIFASIQFEP
jgi:hypothetical protein